MRGRLDRTRKRGRGQTEEAAQKTQDGNLLALQEMTRKRSRESGHESSGITQKGRWEGA